MNAAMTKNAIADQLSLLEAPVTKVLVKGSIKKGMTDANDGIKVASSRDLWQPDPRKLRVIEGMNPRVETPSYLAHIRSIADSMLENGYWQDKPMAGFVAQEDGENIVYIYEGQTRLRAALLAISEGANFDKVPVSVSQEGLSQEDIFIAMVLANEGRPFSMYEKAIMVKRLARNNMPLADISTRLHIEPGMIANMLLLMEAPYQIRELVATEIVAATFAVEMIVKFKGDALDKILAAQSAANAAGKDRVTKRFVPGAKFNKAVKKAAPVMFTTLSELQTDPGFAGLSEETREKLASLLKDLEAAKSETSPGEGSDESSTTE